MSIPRHDTIPIATAAAVAARLPGTRPEGAGYRTRGYCHGSQDKPDSASLVFADPPRPGEQSLHVHCFKCNPQTPEERDAIRHALQKASGLQICVCPACRQAARAPGRPGYGRRRQHQTHTTKRQPAPKGNTADYAAQLWQQAIAVDRAPRPDTPIARWIVDRDLWPPDQPLPGAVRVLTRNHLPAGRQVRPDSNAAAGLVLAMRPLDDPTAAPAKVQIVAIDAAGRKAQHWQGKPGDKRTYGVGAAYGLLWRGELQQSAPYHLHACEGLADGLRILRYAEEPAVIAVCAGKAYHGLQPAWFASCTLWPDADDDKALDQARAQAQTWANAGLADIHIARLPTGHDPASAPLTGDQE